MAYGTARYSLVWSKDRHGRTALSVLGREVVRFALQRYSSVDETLRAFEKWKRSRQRFYDVAPNWRLLTRWVVFDYPATQLLVEELQHFHEDAVREPTLVQFVEVFNELHPSFAVELFVRGTNDVRRRVLTPDGELRGELADGNVYHAPTVFQLKAMLYHAEILTDRGSEPNDLDP